MNPLQAEGLKALAMSESRGWDGAESKRVHSLEGPDPRFPPFTPLHPARAVAPPPSADVRFVLSGG